METTALIKSSFTPLFSFVDHKSCELRSFPDKGCGRGVRGNETGYIGRGTQQGRCR